MGATTALLYGDRDPSIAAMVLDSPFADLMQLANELAQNAREQGLRVPGFAAAPEPEEPRVPAAMLEEALQSFEAVAGVGGTTAQYYVYSALSRGGTLEVALQFYFDGGCEPAPPGWRLPTTG